MKVILLKDVKDLGPVDTIANVSDGFARNFLLPNKHATIATESAMIALESRKKDAEAKREKERSAFRELAARINGAEIKINVDAGESGKLFGSVTAADISKKAYDVLGVEVDKKKLILDEPIKTTGVFEVHVKYASDISAVLKVNVTSASK